MKRVIAFVLTAIIISMFFFPFEFTFLKAANTKMIMAVFGLVIFVFQSLRSNKGMVVSSEFFSASIIAGVFSFLTFFAVFYNNTNEVAYTTYVVSMWVWFFAAYAACNLIAQIHGYISVKLIINYLIAICVAQCIIALLIDNMPSVQLMVDRIIAVDSEKMEQINRLYGIGASLDVAGTRFSAVLVMISVLISHDSAIRANRKIIALYIFLFAVIAVIGSMIARTTNVGIIIAFAYLLYRSGVFNIRIQSSNLKVWGVLVMVVLFLILVCIYLYNNVPAANKLLVFAFEGLISWLETGEWRTDSTDVLQTMWVFPESFETWIIGDGYFSDPMKPGFYMETDVGYLRFIYLCGLIGLSAFSIFFIYLSIACYRRFPQERNLFLLLCLLTFAIWIKVATDIFLVYALFMCIPMVQKHTNNQLTRRL